MIQTIYCDLFDFADYNRRPARCHIELNQLDDGRTVVIATEIEGNSGMSVTNAAELVAWEVCKRFNVDPSLLVWIEHYMPDDPHHGLRKGKASWDLVTFNLTDGRGRLSRFASPLWRPMRRIDWIELGMHEPEGS